MKSRFLRTAWIFSMVLGLTGMTFLFLAVPKGFAESTSRAEAAMEEENKDNGSMSQAVKAVAAAIAFGLAALATGKAQSSIGAAGIGAIAENPKNFGTALIFLALPETILIFGFTIAAIILLVI